MQTCLNMYNDGTLPVWNVSIMFTELQKFKAIEIDIMVSEFDYIIIFMTGASSEGFWFFLLNSSNS